MTCVIVLGVPRSGTSAVAGFLQTHLGVFMGDDQMAPMDNVNPKGFFEDMEFHAKHVEILGSHYDPQLPAGGVPACPAEVLDGYRELIRRRERDHPLWGVKDPKMCFLLTYFLRQLTTPYKIIRTARSFLASVESLMPLYGGMTLDQAILRIGRYEHAMEYHLRELKKTGSYDVCRVSYDSLTSSPDGPVYDMIEHVGLKLEGFSREQLRRMPSWFDPSLRHH